MHLQYGDSILLRREVKIPRVVETPLKIPYLFVKFTLEQRSSGQAKIVTFATLLEYVHDDHLENAIRHETNRFLQSRKIKIGSEDLLQCAVNIYHGI